MDSFDDVAVRLVADDARAQKLVAAWPAVRRCRTKKDFERWAAIAMVPTSAARLIGASLIQLGICGPDGSVPEKARQIVVAASVSHATSRGARKRRSA